MRPFLNQDQNPFTLKIRDRRYRRAAEKIEKSLAAAGPDRNPRLAQLRAVEERINRKRMLEVFILLMKSGANK